MGSPFNIINGSAPPGLPVPSPGAHPRPEWLRVKFFGGERYQNLKRIMRTLDLHTVCESARCPNMGECWEHGTATFMILGDICTRACGFCAVPSGKPAGPPDEEEPHRVAEAVARMGLRYAVVTSVNRDDQKDGGAHIFARTIEEIRRRLVKTGQGKCFPARLRRIPENHRAPGNDRRVGPNAAENYFPGGS